MEAEIVAQFAPGSRNCCRGTPGDGARAIADRIGYPVLVRPSYVLGGRAMEIVHGARAIAAVAPAPTFWGWLTSFAPGIRRRPFPCSNGREPRAYWWATR